MRKSLYTTLAVALLAVPTLAQAQNSASATVTAQVNVIKGLTMTALGAVTLDFGTQASGAGNVTKDPITGTGIPGFAINGQPNTSVNITTAPASIQLANAGATTPISFTPSLSVNTAAATQSASTAAGGSATLNATGNMWLWVGGQIALGATPTAHDPGTYSGTVTVTVAY